MVLKILLESGMQVNPRKCIWASNQIEYLGYVLSKDGIKPQEKKIEALLNIKEPTNKKQLRRFIGMIIYYKEMFSQRAHIMKPLTSLTGKNTKWVWGEEQSRTFHEVKKKLSEITMLTFPNFDKEFHVHTDASDYQMGGVVSQLHNKIHQPIGYFSKKFNFAQLKYPTIEQELLSICETLTYFRCILLGQKVIVWTDHKNLRGFNTKYKCDRVHRQRL